MMNLDAAPGSAAIGPAITAMALILIGAIAIAVYVLLRRRPNSLWAWIAFAALILFIVLLLIVLLLVVLVIVTIVHTYGS